MQFRILVNTHSEQEMINITPLVQQCVDKSGIKNGLCFAVVPHATAALTVNEDKSPELPPEMLQTTDDLIPQKDTYEHFNTAAHLQASFIGQSETLLVEEGKLALGYFQAIYLVELDGPRSPRRVLVCVLPDDGPVIEIAEEHVYGQALVVHGPDGFGGPVVVAPRAGKDLVVSLTGGGVHPGARHSADLSGGTAVDGTVSMPPLDRVAAAVVNGELGEVAIACLQSGIPVINVGVASAPEGLTEADTPDLYVTAVRPGDDIIRAE